MSEKATDATLKVFLSLGLTEDHCSAYTSLLRSGTTSASKVARSIKTPRSTTYEILDDLIEWRLVSIEEHYGKRLYKGENPNILHDHMIYKKNRINDIEYEFRNEVSLLNKKYFETRSLSRIILSPKLSKGVEEEIKYLFSKGHARIFIFPFTSEKDNQVEIKVLLETLIELTLKHKDTTNVLIPSQSNLAKEFLKTQEELDHIRLYNISKRLFDDIYIKFILNDSINYLNVSGNKITGIHDKATLKLESEMFDIFWQRAEELV